MEIDSTTEPDLVAALGYLCLGSRLKRLGERLQSGVAQLLAEQGHAVQPAQLTLLMALYREGDMTIGQLGERIGISQPGVSRAIAALEVLGLVAVRQGGHDKRQRRIAMTAPAKAQMAEFERSFFPAVDRAVAQLCRAGETDLLGDLAGIEAGLASMPQEMSIRKAMANDGHG